MKKINLENMEQVLGEIIEEKNNTTAADLILDAVEREYEQPVYLGAVNNDFEWHSGLYPQQLEAVEAMKAFVTASPDNVIDFEGCNVDISVGRIGVAPVFILNGKAGVGKSFTIDEFKRYLIEGTTFKVAVTAPTHKAVKVLKKYSEIKSHDRLKFSTIHSLLGLRHDINIQNGKEIFKRDNSIKDYPIDNYDILILDEFSMLHSKMFTEYIVKAIQEKGLKVILVGDDHQIPPVGESKPLTNNPKVLKDYSFITYTLTEVLRQAQDNPIIQLANTVRSRLNSSVSVPIRKTALLESGDGVEYILDNHTRETKRNFYRLVKEYFTSEDFKNDSDYCKVIAWTNKTVNTINRNIRTLMFGKDINKLVVGEKIIADKPIFNKEKTAIIFNTNDEMEVLKLQEVVNTYGTYEIKVYEVLVSSLEVSGIEVKKKITVVHEESQELYDEILKYLIARAKNAQGFEKGGLWRNFYNFKKNFAEIKYNYCLTAHKSQGSSYQYVFVIDDDIANNSKVAERNSLRYVAYTRPRKLLYIRTSKL